MVNRIGIAIGIDLIPITRAGKAGFTIPSQRESDASWRIAKQFLDPCNYGHAGG
jgi:hypothetical protein